MRESCEIGLEPGRNLGVVQRFRFVARAAGGEEVAASPPFWSLSGLVFPAGPPKTRVRDLLHALTLAGWHAASAGEAGTRGRA